MEDAVVHGRSAYRAEGAKVYDADDREEAVVVALRRRTLLALDDRLYALQATIPHLTRSSLHRRLQRARH